MILVVVVLTALAFGGLGFYLLSRDDGPNEPLWALLTVFMIGLAAAQLSGVINDKLIPYPADTSLGLSGALMVGIIPGIYEELLKSLPVAFFVGSQPFFRRPSDGVIYFAFSGLAFGLLENIEYTMQQGALVGFDRLLTLLFFHAATSGIFGWYFYRARYYHEWPAAMRAAGYLMLAHAGYNFSVAYANAVPLLRVFAYGISLSLSLQLIRIYSRARRGDRQAH